MGCAPVGDEGQHRPIESVADEKDKGGRPVHNARTERFARDFEFVKPIVAGSGLSADWENSAAGQPDSAPEPSAGSVLHHSDHLLPHQFGDQRRQHPLASSGLAGQEGLKRRGLRKMQLLDADHRVAHTLVHQDAGQAGERLRRVARDADRGGVGRHQRIKRISQCPPRLVNLVKGVDFEQG